MLDGKKIDDGYGRKCFNILTVRFVFFLSCGGGGLFFLFGVFWHVRYKGGDDILRSASNLPNNNGRPSPRFASGRSARLFEHAPKEHGQRSARGDRGRHVEPGNIWVLKDFHE